MNITEPQPRQRIRAGDIARIAAEVKRNHLIAGPGIKLSRTPSGTVVRSTATGTQKVAAGGGLYPFKVRYHEPPSAEDGGEPPEGQWEVYLPSGACTIRSGCYVMNNPAKDTGGHEDDAPEWHAFPIDENPTENGMVYFIIAHGKENVRMASGEVGGNDAFTEGAAFLAVTAEEVGQVDEEHQTAANKYRENYAGDAWSTTIAIVTIKRESDEESGETIIKRSVMQIAKSAVNVSFAFPTYFRPVYHMSWDAEDADTPISVEALYLEDRVIYVGGVATMAPNVNLKQDGECRIYLTIDTSGDTPTAELSVVEEEDGEEPKDSTATSQPIQLFAMNDMYITADLRNNLTNLPYYRGIA